MLAPYRTQSNIDKYVPKKYGLIKVTGSNPWKGLVIPFLIIYEIVKEIKAKLTSHRCNYPGRFKRFGHWIVGAPFAKGSLYRCTCDKIWESSYKGKWQNDSYYGHSQWKKAGGEE